MFRLLRAGQWRSWASVFPSLAVNRPDVAVVAVTCAEILKYLQRGPWISDTTGSTSKLNHQCCDLLIEKRFPQASQKYSTWTNAAQDTDRQKGGGKVGGGESHLCWGPYMSRNTVGTMSSVPCPRGDVCKWVRLILHVGLFACQNLSLIVRGQCSHKADGVPKDVFRRLCETEKQRPKRCGVPLKSNLTQIPDCKEFVQFRFGASWEVPEEFGNDIGFK